MDMKFSEFRKVISKAFADMVEDECITQWQAGYFFALLLCYYDEHYVFDSLSVDEDYSDYSVGFSNFGERPILNKELYVKKGETNGTKFKN